MGAGKLGKRLPAVLVATASVAALVIAVTGAGAGPKALAFLAPGHWVFNTGLGSLFHIDGATGNVDAQIKGVEAEPGSEVVQHGTKGYVIGEDVSVVDLPTLSVEKTVDAPGEEGVVLRTAAGPYVMYPKTGTIARMNDPIGTLAVGAPFTGQVATPDGTVWLRRTDNGRLCVLRKDASTVPCPIETPKDDPGVLTVVAGKAAFVDTVTDTVHTVGESELGEPVEIGIDVPADVVAAESEVSGRIPLLDRKAGVLHLVDPGQARAEVQTVRLPQGDYEAPVSAGAVVALVDKKSNTLLTYDGDGNQHHDKRIPPETGKPKLTKGDDARVYVEGDKGAHVLVIDRDGRIADVPVNAQAVKTSTAAQPPPAETQLAQPPPPNTNTNTNPPRQQPPPPVVPAKKVPPPPVIVASPPGAPGGVSAVAGPGTAAVSWSPAPANGAVITGYTVAWTGSNGTNGAVPTGGTSVNLTGLVGGVTYTVSVRATNSAGQGPAAAATVVPLRTPRLILSRGSKNCPDQFDGPSCYMMRIQMSGFPPNTKINVHPYSTNPSYRNPGHGVTTDADGTEDFEAFAYVTNGDTVWVGIERPGPQVESNRLVWGQW